MLSIESLCTFQKKVIFQFAIIIKQASDVLQLKIDALHVQFKPHYNKSSEVNLLYNFQKELFKQKMREAEGQSERLMAQQPKQIIEGASIEQSKKNKVLLTIFIIGVIGFAILIYNRPKLSNPQVFDNISFPPTPHDLYNVSKVLSLYTEQHFFFSLFAFIYLYILLQAFAIPGPVFLCILSPTLYGPIFGFFLSLSCSCLGASLCFFLSYSLAKELVLRKFPSLFNKFNGMVKANQKNLFWYMMFLRLTPLIPNWFVNLASPLVGMPYVYFIIASFFGLMPNNFILIQTGLTLKEIDRIGVSPKAFITLLCLGFLSLIPTFIGRKYENKFGQQSQYQEVSSNENQPIVTER